LAVVAVHINVQEAALDP